MRVTYIKCAASLGAAVTLALLLSEAVCAQEAPTPGSLTVPLKSITIDPGPKQAKTDKDACWEGGCGLPHPDNDDDGNSNVYCGPGWVATSSGKCRHAPGSIACGDDGSRCDAGNVCANGNECVSINSKRVCPNGGVCEKNTVCSPYNYCIPEGTVGCSDGTHCPLGTLCTPPGQTDCLRPDSPRVCPNHKDVCADPQKTCYEDNTCWRPAGNGLIGGLSWITGYNVHGLSPKAIERAKKLLKRQMESAHLPYDAIDFKKYEFILGIGASTEKWYTVGGWPEDWRVFREQFQRGQHSAETQGLYNSLKGRAFDELDCHSNGAMTCLAALENGDARAENVALFGPQITVESLLEWNYLLKEGKVQSVRIYLNKGDPIPALSLVAVTMFRDAAEGSYTAALLKLALFNRSILTGGIHMIAPDIQVVPVDTCTSPLPDADCHLWEKYKR